MGDPQRKNVSELDIGWVCGLFDGEGYVGGYWQGKAKGINHYLPVLTISNTDMPTLNKLTEIMDKLGFAYYIYWQNRPSHYGIKKLWQLKIAGIKRCQRWLEFFAPILCGKKPQAEAMIDLCRSRLERPQKHPYTEYERQLIERLTTLKH